MFQMNLSSFMTMCNTVAELTNFVDVVKKVL